MPGTNFPNGIRAPLLQPNGVARSSITNLTDNSGGTSSNTIAAIGGTYNQAEMRNAIASLSAKITELNNALTSTQVTGG